MTNEEWLAWSDQSWSASLATSDAVNRDHLAASDARVAEREERER